MYSSNYLSKRFVLVHILAMQLLIRSVLSVNVTNEYLHHKCIVSQGNYKPGSVYEKELNGFIKSVSTQILENGFTSMSYGDPPNSIVIVFQCRGDSYGSKCRSCYATAVAAFRKRCPKSKAAIIWYEQCVLDISTIEYPALPKIDDENTFSMHNPNNVKGDTVSFNKNTRDLLTGLIPKAMVRDRINYVYYAAGEKRLGPKKLYAMVQCAQYELRCKVCLERSIREISKCCGGKQGARLYLGRSCNVRYELYPFLTNQK